MITLKQLNDINDILIKYDVSAKDYPECGIYFQPAGIPIKYKEYVICCKQKRRGASGGSCWGDEAEYFTCDVDEGLIINVVRDVANYLNISITDEEIVNMVSEGELNDYEYYGNYTDYDIRYLPLSRLYLFTRGLKLGSPINQDFRVSGLPSPSLSLIECLAITGDITKEQSSKILNMAMAPDTEIRKLGETLSDEIWNKLNK